MVSPLPCPTLNTKVSLPALPVSWSAPPWPSSTLLPELPKIELASALPVPLRFPLPCNTKVSTLLESAKLTEANNASLPAPAPSTTASAALSTK